ncbi:hypothetical protein [Serratia quinivorans]|uniref:hypothetical protein n=1 Tax=Serratia quinivorans TaxID=137545 RepID=UPI003F969CC5
MSQSKSRRFTNAVAVSDPTEFFEMLILTTGTTAKTIFRIAIKSQYKNSQAAILLDEN